MQEQKEQIDTLEIAGMWIDINDALGIRLLGFCDAEIRRALDDGELDSHAEEMIRLKRGLKKSDKAVLEKYKRHILAGIMWIAGFRFASAEWATDWQDLKRQEN